MNGVLKGQGTAISPWLIEDEWDFLIACRRGNNNYVYLLNNLDINRLGSKALEISSIYLFIYGQGKIISNLPTKYIINKNYSTHLTIIQGVLYDNVGVGEQDEFYIYNGIYFYIDYSPQYSGNFAIYRDVQFSFARNIKKINISTRGDSYPNDWSNFNFNFLLINRFTEPKQLFFTYQSSVINDFSEKNFYYRPMILGNFETNNEQSLYPFLRKGNYQEDNWEKGELTNATYYKYLDIKFGITKKQADEMLIGEKISCSTDKLITNKFGETINNNITKNPNLKQHIYTTFKTLKETPIKELINYDITAPLKIKDYKNFISVS